MNSNLDSKSITESAERQVSRDFEFEMVETIEATSLNFIGTSPKIVHAVTSNRNSIREWWHQIIGNYGKFDIYAVVLLLPSDKEAINQFIEYGDELKLLMGRNCLLLLLGESEFYLVDNQAEDLWVSAVDQHVSSGESIGLAQALGIALTEFPCIVFFDDIRNPDYVTISLSNLQFANMTLLFRKIFSELRKRNRDERPIRLIRSAIAHHQQEQFKIKSWKIGAALVTDSIKTAIDSWIKASVG